MLPCRTGPGSFVMKTRSVGSAEIVRRHSKRTPALRKTASVSSSTVVSSDGDTSAIAATSMTIGGAVRLTGAPRETDAANAATTRAATGIVRIDGARTRKLDVRIR